MSKKLLRISVSFLAGLMLASTLTACGVKKQEEKPSETQKPIADQKPVTIDWLAYSTVAQPDPESEIVKMVEKKFNAKFNFWFVDDQKYVDNLSIKLASGEMPDIMKKSSMDIKKLLNQGILKEIPLDTLKKKAPNYMKMVDQYDKDGIMFMGSTVDGKNYGFSSFNLNAYYPPAMVWRMDWLKNVGINKVPETLKEFDEAVTKFTKNDPDKNGKNDTYGISNFAMPAVFGAFGPIPMADLKGNPVPELGSSKKDGKIVVSAIQPEMKEALTLMQKWYKEGIIDPEFITGENKGGYWATSHAFINGKVGVTKGMFYHWIPPLIEGEKGGTVYQEFQKVKPDVKYGETYALGKGPIGTNGKGGTDQWSYVADTFVMTKNVDKDPRKMDTILGLLDAACVDGEYATTLEYGIKDVDYKLDKDGNVIRITASAADIRKKGIMVLNIQEFPDMLKRLQPARFKFAESVKGPGYTPISLPAVDAYTKYAGDLKKMALEAYLQIITGEKPVDYFDEFVKQFRSKGGDELEKQYSEAWKNLGGK